MGLLKPIETAEELAIILYVEYCEHEEATDYNRQWCESCLLKMIKEYTESIKNA